MTTDEESLEETPLITENNSSKCYENIEDVIYIDPRKSKLSYGHMTIYYAAILSLVLSLFCFTISYTVSAPGKDRPIEMEEADKKKSIPRSFDNGDLLNRHEQGDDDYTSDFHPYFHTFIDKDLWLDGTNDDKTPKKGSKFHLKFFKIADFSSFNTDWTYTTNNIGEFKGVDPDGNMILSNGTICKEGKKENSGIIKIIYGPEIKIIDISEPEPCYYEFIVSSPDLPSPAPTLLPTVEPTIESSVEPTMI